VLDAVAGTAEDDEVGLVIGERTRDPESIDVMDDEVEPPSTPITPTT
jgi:hypothetical protein